MTKLDLSHNNIERIQNLSHLRLLETLDMTQNRMTSCESLRLLVFNPSLSLLILTDNPLCWTFRGSPSTSSGRSPGGYGSPRRDAIGRNVILKEIEKMLPKVRIAFSGSPASPPIRHGTKRAEQEQQKTTVKISSTGYTRFNSGYRTQSRSQLISRALKSCER